MPDALFEIADRRRLLSADDDQAERMNDVQHVIGTGQGNQLGLVGGCRKDLQHQGIGQVRTYSTAQVRHKMGRDLFSPHNLRRVTFSHIMTYSTPNSVHVE